MRFTSNVAPLLPEAATHAGRAGDPRIADLCAAIFWLVLAAGAAVVVAVAPRQESANIVGPLSSGAGGEGFLRLALGCEKGSGGRGWADVRVGGTVALGSGGEALAKPDVA